MRSSATLIAYTVSGGMKLDGYPRPPVIAPAGRDVGGSEPVALGDGAVVTEVVGEVVGVGKAVSASEVGVGLAAT